MTEHTFSVNRKTKVFTAYEDNHDQESKDAGNELNNTILDIQRKNQLKVVKAVLDDKMKKEIAERILNGDYDFKFIHSIDDNAFDVSVKKRTSIGIPKITANLRIPKILISIGEFIIQDKFLMTVLIASLVAGVSVIFGGI